MITKFVLTIDNFDNGVMADDPNGEVCRLLRDTAKRVEACLGCNYWPLRDVNGNVVGRVTIEE